MAIYYCRGCNRCLNLSDEYLYPPNTYFGAGNKGTVSFSAVDKTDFRQKEQNKCFPFFETLDYWGFQRHRTRLTCAACGKKLGYIYYDGPSSSSSDNTNIGAPNLGNLLHRPPCFCFCCCFTDSFCGTTTVGASTYIAMFSNASATTGFPVTMDSASASSCDSSSPLFCREETRAGDTGRTLQFNLQEYLRRFGCNSVFPLKLGRDIFIEGPGHPLAGAPMTALLRSSMLQSGLRKLPLLSTISNACLVLSLPLPILGKKLHQGFLSSVDVFSENSAVRLGSPTSSIPWSQASLLFTITRAAHAQDVGGFQTIPANNTSSSKTPAGLESYLAK